MKQKVFKISQTLLIKITLPLAAQLGFYFLKGITVMLHLLEGPGKGLITQDRRRKKPRTWRDSNQQSLYYEACALPLCCNIVGYESISCLTSPVFFRQTKSFMVFFVSIILSFSRPDIFFFKKSLCFRTYKKRLGNESTCLHFFVYHMSSAPLQASFELKALPGHPAQPCLFDHDLSAIC